jgi:pimeloyl-ACP methyl ester carboxylesterase
MAELRSLNIVGPSGQLDNVRFEGNGRRLALVLPGFRGGWMTAAVYYPVLALQESASDVICMESIYSEHPPRDRFYADAASALQAAGAIGSDHGEVIAGKSLGTVQMAELLTRGDLSSDTLTIWLTPLLLDPAVAGAIASLTRPALVVIGTDDPHYDAQQLRELSETGHQTLVLDRANHGLAIMGDADASARIPLRLVAAVRSYLSEQAC